MSEAIFQHAPVSDKKFERAIIVLDSMDFKNCSFKDCEVFYSGGPFEAHSCQFENVRWHFQGAAALTVETMQKLGWTVKPPESEQRNCRMLESRETFLT
jgi:hypothetical protein